ncbi:unnamed protein product [Cercopithifilaria johnstoni]|uniref:Uncharacterized protein n=1 Tax=Cercopithifilaria johnstoni TaxID=2874296 RepID=A0A8J2MSR8_9BILA|nr:unnamed protein product [Cercopithifilaria johnstoni]
MCINKMKADKCGLYPICLKLFLILRMVIAGVQQEAEEELVTVAPAMFIVKPNGTTSAESSKSTVISTQKTPNKVKCTLLPIEPTCLEQKHIEMCSISYRVNCSCLPSECTYIYGANSSHRDRDRKPKLEGILIGMVVPSRIDRIGKQSLYSVLEGVCDQVATSRRQVLRLGGTDGGEMQGNLSSQQFQSLTTHLDHCLNALRLLRNEVISVHRRIVEGSWESDPAEGEKTLEEKLDFINQIYDNLESHAKQLPVSTPMTVQMERLSRFLHDGQIDPHTSELYDKALEASTWMETNNQLLQMYAEFLRTVVGNRRRSIMTDRPISYSNYGLNSSPQSIFEQTLTVVLKDPNIKKIGLVGRYLERSTLSALVEFKFGQVIDKQYVCLLKMLMVVNSGVPEFVQMIAPHEEWSYLDVGCSQVDIHKESRYLVYRKMSVQANIHLMQTIMPCIDIRNAHTLSYVLNLFAKFSGVFDIKCRVCKKIMKDYLPPLMFDLRCPKNALHESCR